VLNSFIPSIKGSTLKKIVALASAILVAGGIAFPTAAAQAACANYAIWTYGGGETGFEVKRWSTNGTLLSTVETTIDSPDMALSSDLTKFLAVDNNDPELKTYNSSTGEFIAGHAITGSLTGSGAGAGVVASGALLVDAQGDIIYSMDLSTYNTVAYADLKNADSDLNPLNQGGSWTVAGDILQLPDGDVLVLAKNTTFNYTDVLILRVNTTTTTDIDVVGIIDATTVGEIWGAARAGDDIFLATENGALLKLASVPFAVSTGPVSFTETVSGGGSFWGAAGSNDATDGSATCSGTPSVAIVGGTEGLAKTGGSENVGIVAGVLVFATAVAGLALRRRRRNV
jgi:LPXTG-motif cell wall-anchored protein